MSGYPRWRYHATEEALIVRSAAQDEALGPGWADSPSAFGRDTENATDHTKAYLKPAIDALAKAISKNQTSEVTAPETPAGIEPRKPRKRGHAA